MSEYQSCVKRKYLAEKHARMRVETGQPHDVDGAAAALFPSTQSRGGVLTPPSAF
jgi:hypothetical protein